MKIGDTACLVRYYAPVSMKKLMTTENCFCRSGDGTFSETFKWEGISEEVNSYLKCIGPEVDRMLLHLLKRMINVNGEYTSTYEQFHIKIIRNAFVAVVGIPTCRDVTLGVDVYVKHTGRRVIQKIFASYNFYNTGRDRLSNVMIQTGKLQQEQSTRP